MRSRFGLLAVVCVLGAGLVGCGGDDTGDELEFPDLGVLDLGDRSDGGTPDGGDPNAVCGDGVRQGTEECDDDNTMDGDGCSATCTVEDGCSRALDLATVGTATSNGYTYSGNTSSGFDGARSSSCGGAGAKDIVLAYNPPSEGDLTVLLDAEFSGTVYVRAACSTPSSELSCGTGGAVAHVTAGSPVYIFVDGLSSTSAGTFTVSTLFIPTVAEGAACDPDGEDNNCAAGLLCAPTSEGAETYTCQADVDLGCGVGVDVRDISALIDEDGAFTLTDSTARPGAGDLSGSCRSTVGSGTAPQRVYKLTLPYRASVRVDMSTIGGWDAILYARSATCTGMELACEDDPESIVIDDSAEGSTIYIVADGRSTGSGFFTLTGTLDRILDEGDACTPGSTDEPCGPGLLCVPADEGHTCEAVDLGCGVGVNVVDLNSRIVDNRITYVGTTAGGYTGARPRCSTSGSTAPQIIHKVTMPFTGQVRVSSSAGFDDVLMLSKSACNATWPSAGGTICNDTPEIAYGAAGEIAEGTVLYIGVGGWSSGVGAYTLNVAFRRVLAEGVECDPTRRGDICGTGLTCLAASESTYACATNADLGCGVGTPVIDVTSLRDPDTGVITFRGSTEGLTSRLGCGSYTTSSGEIAHRIVMPFNGQVSVDLDADFWALAYVRTACTSTTGQRACTTSSPISYATIGSFTAGADVFVIVDGAYSGETGDYTLNIGVRPTAGEGEFCSNGSAGPACVAPFVCHEDGEDSECVTPGCGDGFADAGETCDDGNTMGGDGCSATCALEVQGAGGETCDAPTVLNLVRTSPASGAARASGTTASATSDLAGYCGNSGMANDHVYQFTLTRTSNIAVTATPSSGYDLVVYMRGASGEACTASAGELRCADGAPPGMAETFSVDNVEPGTYYIVIDGRGSSTASRGSYTLNLVATGV